VAFSPQANYTDRNYTLKFSTATATHNSQLAGCSACLGADQVENTFSSSSSIVVSHVLCCRNAFIGCSLATAVPSGSTILVPAIMSQYIHEYITGVQRNENKLELTSSSLSTINITIVRLAMSSFNENDFPEFPLQ
jgi:hypothetical protein